MDERIDMSCAVRNDRYLYIKNFMPFRPQGTYLTYMFQTPTTQVWKKAFDDGKLNEAQSAFWKPKPPEELYDLLSDPFQIHNLAGSEALRSVQQELRDQLRHHMIRTQDKGVVPEAIVKANQVDSNWNWSDLVDAAFQASSLHSPAPDPDSDNPIVRYWAAQRLLVAGANQPTRADYQNACIALLEDSNPSVRITAAEAAGRSTDPDLKRRGFETLLQHCDVEKWGGMQAIAAMNSLVNLQRTIDEPQRKKIGIDPALEPVYREYVTRLLETLGSQQN